MSQTAVNPNNSPNPNRAPQQIYKFTADELRVLKECNIESFYQRCLPFSAGLGLGVYYLIKSGKLSAHPRFGTIPKVSVAVIGGYFLGKLSYQQKCAEKLMALPNSPLGQALRQRKNQHYEGSTQERGFPTPSFTEVPQLPPQQSYLDLDSDNRPFSSPEFEKPLDDQFSMDPIEQSKDLQVTSYEELRKKNREDYENQRNHAYRDSHEQARPVVAAQAAKPSPSPEKRKNKYGDDIE